MTSGLEGPMKGMEDMGRVQASTDRGAIATRILNEHIWTGSKAEWYDFVFPLILSL